MSEQNKTKQNQSKYAHIDSSVILCQYNMKRYILNRSPATQESIALMSKLANAYTAQRKRVGVTLPVFSSKHKSCDVCQRCSQPITCNCAIYRKPCSSRLK